VSVHQEPDFRVRPWIAIGVEMAKVAGWKMTGRQYWNLLGLLDGVNAFEREALLHVLDDLAVCELAISHNRASELAPLLIKRLREARAQNAELDRQVESLLKALDTARKQAATWEIQAQDLRDQLIQVKSELAALKVAEPTYACFACGQPMETRLCWECAK